jgi:hypothetical protein
MLHRHECETTDLVAIPDNVGHEDLGAELFDKIDADRSALGNGVERQLAENRLPAGEGRPTSTLLSATIASMKLAGRSIPHVAVSSPIVLAA